MNKTIEFILMLFLLMSYICIGYMGHDKISSLLDSLKTQETQMIEEIKTPDECVNLSLKDSAYCLRDYIKPFFKYNITDDSIDLTLDELKERGGDCRDWAKLYYSLANDLGFYVERPVIKTSEKFAHTFIVMSDETGYCVIDQLNVKCTKFDNEN